MCRRGDSDHELGPEGDDVSAPRAYPPATAVSSGGTIELPTHREDELDRLTRRDHLGEAPRDRAHRGVCLGRIVVADGHAVFARGGGCQRPRMNLRAASWTVLWSFAGVAAMTDSAEITR